MQLKRIATRADRCGQVIFLDQKVKDRTQGLSDAASGSKPVTPYSTEYSIGYIEGKLQSIEQLLQELKSLTNA